MWKCFKTVIVKVFHSDNLEKGSKVIIVQVFQIIVKVFHSDPKKGSKVIKVEVSKQSLSKCFTVTT